MTSYRKKFLKEHNRLNKLIELVEDSGGVGNCDFVQILFFAKGKTAKTKYRKALDQEISNNI